MFIRHLIIALSLMLAISCTKEGMEEENFGPIGSATTSEIEDQLFNIINEHRSSINLSAFTFDDVTYSYATSHSEYMIAKGVVSHAKFEERAAEISSQTGAEYVAENVANDYLTIEEAMSAWLESPGHKVNIEGNYTHSAISIMKDANNNLYFTQIFYR